MLDLNPHDTTEAQLRRVIGALPAWLRLALSAAGIFACYAASGVFQEWTFLAGLEHPASLSLSVALCSWLGCAALAGVGIGDSAGVLHPGLAAAPLKLHAAVGILSMTSIGMSNWSLVWLNYPTQLLFKSSKVVPVMLGAVLINKKSFWWSEYAAAVALAVGLTVFTLADASVSPAFDATGVLVICGALVADAFVSNTQEKVLVRYNAGAVESLAWANAVASVVWLVILGGSGELGPLVAEFLAGSTTMKVSVVGYGVTQYLGFFFILYSVQTFGAATTVIVTSVRKAFTLVLSYLIFPRPDKAFTGMHAVGLLLVVTATVALTVLKRRKKRRPVRTRTSSGGGADSSSARGGDKARSRGAVPLEGVAFEPVGGGIAGGGAAAAATAAAAVATADGVHVSERIAKEV